MMQGYATGCDDYMVKPFSLSVLYAKCLAIMKRAKGTIREDELVCDAIRMNVLKYRVTVDGKEVDLSLRYPVYCVYRHAFHAPVHHHVRTTRSSHHFLLAWPVGWTIGTSASIVLYRIVVRGLKRKKMEEVTEFA